MNCPRCETSITKLVRYCSSCKYDFGKELYDKFSFYFSWKGELDKLTELQNTLYAGIANVSAKIRRYEEILNRDLARAASSPGPQRKKSARAKKRR